ncbi:methionine gamma-lyase family protein [Bacillus sp. Marseille-P3661]|uniref:methionine gamma-lyase family protein n=1 Tax=Bacillus sp. Marseille-P3661 TaxID=1936234 RepID=UPI000C846712|nr:methionine gamma-lyase family protein [Bacillus sp. Marseille-P3661]
MYGEFGYGKQISTVVNDVEVMIKPLHQAVDEITEKNQFRVLAGFRKHQVSDFHFTPSTGYGYDDTGRDTLEKVYAYVFGAEAGLVRPQIISGTHAISVSLFGVLRPGDELLYITGRPYDTLEEIVGIRGNKNGSLREFNIGYESIPLTEDGAVDYNRVQNAIKPNTKVIGIQRSKGYSSRPSFTIQQIKDMITFVKECKSDVIVFVDNCYGEFVEELEPCHVGADLVAGSLIKNPGGGLVKTGGYIVGKEDLVEQCAYRLTAPGIGREAGASLYSLHEMFQGFFLAPHIVGQAVKGAIFTSAFLSKLGFVTYPGWNQTRTDLVQSVQFNNREMMIAFCQAIQYASPVNSHVKPMPSYMPGYEDDVIMAAGTFIQGASIELTADGPMRPPYEVYVQGGLTYEHVKIAIITAVKHLHENGLVQLSDQ